MLKTVPELVSEARQHIRCIATQTAVSEHNQNSELLIDVQEPAEYAAKSAQGAINIPRGVLEMKILDLEKMHNGPKLALCDLGSCHFERRATSPNRVSKCDGHYLCPG